MRAPLDAEKVHRLLGALGRAARGPGRYLTGGTTAVLEGWRAATIDADLKLDPEPPGIFEALPRIKDELGVNVELAAPDDFIPPLPGWRERSRFIARHGQVDFFHCDDYAQALSKVERGHDRDIADVRAMLDAGLIEPVELRRHFDAIAPAVPRYPAIDVEVFRRKLEELLAGGAGDG